MYHLNEMLLLTQITLGRLDTLLVAYIVGQWWDTAVSEFRLLAVTLMCSEQFSSFSYTFVHGFESQRSLPGKF